jgi:succinate dehydrogenase / fumarate reductase cytochrome b subunit
MILSGRLDADDLWAVEFTSMNLLPAPARSSLGKKYLMAITGLLLIGFVLAHMAGNLLILLEIVQPGLGRDALNGYAQKLKGMGSLLWIARGGLLLLFVVHLYLALKLRWENSAARPKAYAYQNTLQASWASRHMLLTGLVLFAFILYHLAHFTFGLVHEAKAQSQPDGKPFLFDYERNYLDLHEIRKPDSKSYTPANDMTEDDVHKYDHRHDVYSMVVSGFQNPIISGSYLLAMLFLGLHLWHGGSSWLQSLGIAGVQSSTFVRCLGPIIAVIVVTGNCSIPLSVWLGLVK